MSISRRFFRCLNCLFHTHLRLAVILLALAATAGVSHAATITVAAGGDFQAALYAAQPGDTIILVAGATYRGPFDLPDKVGAEFITIRSSRAAELPEGVRVTPAHAPLMPRITGPAYSYTVKAVRGAHHYRFEGIEFAPVDAQAFSYHLIQLGGWGAEQDSLDEVPHHLSFDRCYVHAFPGQEVIRGILLNSAHTDLTNSHVSDFKSRGFDSQAVGGYNGPGPFRIINNYLEGSGENVMFGGADPSIPNLVPADIEIRRNHFAKPVLWRAEGWSVKNLFELKNARRVIIDGNVFENNWGHAQTGEAILFTVRNQSGGCNWCVIEDVQFTNNIVRHAGAGIMILGVDYYFPSEQTKRITIRNNLFEDIDGGAWNGRGEFLMMTRTAQDITVDHNTILHSGNLISVGEGPHTGFRFTNNVGRHNEYGIFGNGTGSGTAAITQYFPDGVVRGNAIAGADANRYPTDNFYPWQWGEVGFVDAANGDYRLSASSPYRGRATDGTDIGCDFAALWAAIGGTTPTPRPTPTPTPTPEAGWTFCGTEDQRCSFTGTRRVRYGANGTYNYGTYTDGVNCSYLIFGDPLVGTYKQCSYGEAITPTPTPTPTPVPTPTPNTAPAVSLTSPTVGATFTAPVVNITIDANATDSDGAVAKVEFYQGSIKLGEDIAAPYSYTWGSVPAGNYILTAKATDNTGATTMSSPVSTTVSITVNSSPADFSLSAPPTSRSIKRGAQIKYTITATPSGGFTGSITFGVSSALPAGVSASFSPQSVNTSGSSTITVRTSSTTPTGSYVLTISGTGGGLQRTTSVPLDVR